MSHIDSPEFAAARQAALRVLPSVDQLLNHHAVAPLELDVPRAELIAAVRAVLDARRRAILESSSATPPPEAQLPAIALEIRAELQRRARSSLRRVINATGVVLHTGLGRAPLPEEAVNSIVDLAGGYCNLELNLESGERGDRHEHVRALLVELTGAEDALVVNNNAAATLLALTALAAGREVIVSRGQLVEIGGSYRMPEIMVASGCRMVEVGTTNRTRIADYAGRIGPDTAALLCVHTSNYRIRGFTASATLRELVELGRQRGLPAIDDLGSGLLDAALIRDQQGPARPSASTDESTEDFNGSAAAAPATWDEPTVRDSVAAGAALTLFSGDKLLGGPQAGILVGQAKLIAACRAHPLMRAVRPDKLAFAALEATLRLYRDMPGAAARVPTLRMLTARADELEAAAARLLELISQHAPGADARLENDVSFAGGGALPVTEFPTHVVALRTSELPAEKLAHELRVAPTPIICRVRDGAVRFDPRTLGPEDAEIIAAAVGEIIREAAPALAVRQSAAR